MALHPHQCQPQPKPAQGQWMRMFLGHHPRPGVGDLPPLVHLSGLIFSVAEGAPPSDDI